MPAELVVALQKEISELTPSTLGKWLANRASTLKDQALQDETRNPQLRAEAKLAFELATNPQKQVDLSAGLYYSIYYDQIPPDGFTSDEARETALANARPSLNLANQLIELHAQQGTSLYLPSPLLSPLA